MFALSAANITHHFSRHSFHLISEKSALASYFACQKWLSLRSESRQMARPRQHAYLKDIFTTSLWHRLDIACF